MRVAVGTIGDVVVDTELGVAAKTETAATDPESALERHVEIPSRVEEAVGIDRQQAKEVNASIEVDTPGTVSHNHLETSVEVQDLEQRDSAVHIKCERLAFDPKAFGICRVELDHAARLDLDHGNISFDRHCETHGQTRIGTAEDTCGAGNREFDRTDNHGQAEFDLE